MSQGRQLERPGSPKTACLALVLATLVPPGAEAQVQCSVTGGPPGGTVTLDVAITSPSDGSVLMASSPCGELLDVAGTYAISADALPHDFYIVLDTSGSTDDDSGGDVNGNGILGEPADSIYEAEISAALEFVAAIDPANSRVAVFTFDTFAQVDHELSADLSSVTTVLESLRGEPPAGWTAYVRAMSAVSAEVTARGNPASRRQVCLFLSDGQPNETLAETNAAAANLASQGVVLHTFALGFSNSQALENMATLTSGSSTTLNDPVDVLGLLPGFAPQVSYAIASLNRTTGLAGSAGNDPSAGTFQAQVAVVPGLNDVTVTISSDAPEPLTLQCDIEVLLDAEFVADAGPAFTECAEDEVVLDASASRLRPCASPVYRWLDPSGAEACPPGSDPTCTIMGPCVPGLYTLEMSCVGEPCVAVATVDVSCRQPLTVSPSVPMPCLLSADLSCGTAEAGVVYAWDSDISVDADANGDPTDDVDALGCDVRVAWTTGGSRTARVRATDFALGCEGWADIAVDVPGAPAPQVVARTGCPGGLVSLECGVTDPNGDFWWDLDLAIDSDGDGDPTGDRDLVGCDVNAPVPNEPWKTVAGWWGDAAGCRLQVVEANIHERAPLVVEPQSPWACGLTVDLSCGTPEPGVDHEWDLDWAVDSDGNGDPTDDADASGCEVTHAFATTGLRTVGLTAVDPTLGCSAVGSFELDVVPVAPPYPLTGGVCPGETVQFACGEDVPGAVYWWDLDATTDADGDGDPANDFDASGCELDVPAPGEGAWTVAAWSRDSGGCVAQLIAGAFDVSQGEPPGETPSLLVGRDGPRVDLDWLGVPGADAYRVMRGSLRSLWRDRAHDHRVDPIRGGGACEERSTSFSDLDDGTDGSDHYYLVVAVSPCGGIGASGYGRHGDDMPERPKEVSAIACP